jgi:hypothetical protein
MLSEMPSQLSGQRVGASAAPRARLWTPGEFAPDRSASFLLYKDKTFMTGWVSLQFVSPRFRILHLCHSPLSHSKLTREGEIRRRGSRARTSLTQSLVKLGIEYTCNRWLSHCNQSKRDKHPVSALPGHGLHCWICQLGVG